MKAFIVGAGRPVVGRGEAALLLALAVAAFALSAIDPRLFRVLLEVVWLGLAACIAVIAWNSRGIAPRPILTAVGAAFMGTGLLLGIHFLGVLELVGGRVASVEAQRELALSTRLLEAFTAVLMVRTRRWRRSRWTAPIALWILALALLALITLTGWFPPLRRPTGAPTLWLVALEAGIAAAFLTSVPPLLRAFPEIDVDVLRWVQGALILAAGAEVAILADGRTGGAGGAVSQVLRVLAAYLLAHGTIEAGFKRPGTAMVLELERARDGLQKERDLLEVNVALRTQQLADSNKRLRLEVSERTRLQEQFLQAQKMEAVGQLAGGIAHDFNNILTVVLGHCDQLLERLGDRLDDHRRVKQIHAAAERAALLTRQLLAFSRKTIMRSADLELDRLVEDMSVMVQRLVGDEIVVSFRAEPRPIRIRADRSQIEQVVMNLCVNARDAMPRGGTLLLEVGHASPAGSPEMFPPGTADGTWARLVIADTGSGMDAAVKARIFEPFFTTKGLGQGTGLGLSAVHGIVGQTGGHLHVDSGPGVGTRISVLLPLAGVGEPTPPAAV